MAIDFNADNILHTDKGNFLCITLKYDATFAPGTGFLNNTKLSFKGEPWNSSVYSRVSLCGGGTYRYQDFPAMGTIHILNEQGQEYSTPLSFSATYRSIKTYIDDSIMISAGYTPGGYSGYVSGESLAVIIDNADHLFITPLTLLNLVNQLAYTANTATTFGFWEGYLNPENTISISQPTNYANLNNYPDILEPYYEDDDPYANGGDSDTGGGNGDFDGSGDPVEHPTAPGVSAVDTGFITLFNPTVAQLKSLANYMWSGAFDLETFKKIFADPMDAILGLSMVPVNVPNGSLGSVKVGNIDTGVQMTKANSQYVTVNCGSINVNEYWGAYLDYAPFTKAEIYLPYIGTHAINIDDIMGKTISVQYIVDILSGACNATIKCGTAVLYEFIGHCSASIPISGNDWTNVINGVLTVAGSIGSMVATSGMTAPIAAGTIASTAVNDMKPTVEKSGSLSGSGSLLGIQRPYLMLTRPRQCRPKNQNSFLGYPSFTNQKLENLSGYAELEEVHLENVHASQEETQEIETLLKSGVIF